MPHFYFSFFILAFLLNVFVSLPTLEVDTLTPIQVINPKEKAITHDTHGRLGNQLMTYLTTKWISHNYNLPFLYTPFNRAKNFVFHKQEKQYLLLWKTSFKYPYTLKEISEIPKLPNSTLITINLFHKDGNNPFIKFSHRKIWKDPNFREFAKSLIQPQFPINTFTPPKDKLNVLVHVRSGEGHDSRQTQLRLPYKFPPHSFYISSIEKMSELFNHPLMYVHIMTDDPYPESIVNDYSEALSHLKNVEFGYRKDATVIEDFFSVPNFDCIIRGSSTLTISASLLTKFKATIFPKKCHVENDTVVVDKIHIELNNIEN